MKVIQGAELLALLPPCKDTNLYSDMSRSDAALVWLHRNLVKKYAPFDSNRLAEENAMKLFLENNDKCKLWSPNENSYCYDIMTNAKRIALDALTGSNSSPVERRVTLLRAHDRGVTGPGSSRGTKFNDLIGKLFHSKLSVYDPSLWKFYEQSISSTRWLAAEKVRRKLYGDYTVVQGSSMSFARKDYNIARVINTEASLPMFYQLGIGEQFEDVLECEFNISLSKQPSINRQLARLGSISGNFATEDLKSSSDLISMNFGKWFFDPRTYQTLVSTRAKCIELPDWAGGGIVELNMLSTMGNGFTFPLQTFIYACVVKAVYESMGLPTDCHERPYFSVFGDDIIVLSKAHDLVHRTLEWCGFTVNKDKSFNSGAFRESCGEDYFKGWNIRSVYIKDLRHETHVFSAFNRLARWSINNCVDITGLLKYLLGLVVFRPIPFDKSDTAGIKIPLCMTNLVTKNGFTRYKYVSIRMRSKSIATYESNPDGCLVGCSRISTDNAKLQHHDSTDEDFSSGRIGIRNNPDGLPKTKLRKEVTSSWDWHPNGLVTREFMWLFLALGFELNT